MRKELHHFPGLPIVIIAIAASCVVLFCASRLSRVRALGADAGAVAGPSTYKAFTGFPIAQCDAALSKFEEKALPKLMEAAGDKTNIIGVACVDSGGMGPELLIVCNTEPKQQQQDKFVYSYGNDGAEKTASVRWVLGEEAAEVPGDPATRSATAPATASAAAYATAAAQRTGPIVCGTTAQGQNVSKEGTAGLNIKFNGVAVCISNAHVMALLKDKNGPGTPKDTAVSLGGEPAAKLYCYKPITFGPAAQNFWDLAMAEYTDGGRAAAQMRPCPRSSFNYPSGFATSGSVFTGQTAHYVGASSCGDGLMLIDGEYAPTAAIPENNRNKRAGMAAQLLFTQGTFDRDSGAVIVSSNDLVLGLHMGNTKIDHKFCNYANPLYRVPWAPSPKGADGLLSFTADAAKPYPDLFGDDLHNP